MVDIWISFSISIKDFPLKQLMERREDMISLASVRLDGVSNFAIQ
jgi:hypothetical protein